MMTQPISVHVMHSDPILAAGIVEILRQQPDFVVTSPLTKDEYSGVSVIVADHHDGIEVRQQSLRKLGRDAPQILIVSHLDNEWQVRTAVENGVHGYVLQSGPPEELVNSVRMLGRGLRYFTPAVSAGMASSFERAALTSREQDILQLLGRGLGNKTIAACLGIAPNTVKAHVKTLLQKLGSITRTQAVVTAISRGMIEPARYFERRVGLTHAGIA